MDFQEEIRKNQLLDIITVERNLLPTPKDNAGERINKSVFDEFEPDNIEKSHKANIGEIRMWGDKRVKKQPNGKWVEVSEEGMSKKEHLNSKASSKISSETAFREARRKDLQKYDDEQNRHHENASKLSDKEYDEKEVMGGGKFGVTRKDFMDDFKDKKLSLANIKSEGWKSEGGDAFKFYEGVQSIPYLGISAINNNTSETNYFTIRPQRSPKIYSGEDKDIYDMEYSELTRKRFDTPEEAAIAADKFVSKYKGKGGNKKQALKSVDPNDIHVGSSYLIDDIGENAKVTKMNRSAGTVKVVFGDGSTLDDLPYGSLLGKEGKGSGKEEIIKPNNKSADEFEKLMAVKNLKGLAKEYQSTAYMNQAYYNAILKKEGIYDRVIAIMHELPNSGEYVDQP